MTIEGTRITRLVNGATGEVVDADDGAWHADRLRAAATRLAITLPRPTPKDTMGDEARAEAALASAGWSGFSGILGPEPGHRSLFGRRLADMSDLLAIAETAGLSAGDTTYLDTLDCGILRATRADAKAMLAGEFPARSMLGEQAGWNTRMNRILDAVAASPVAASTTVFGSMARGRHGPGDLDLYVDTRALDAAAREWCRVEMLGLAARHAGLLDPFLTNHRGTFTRNAESTGWEASRQSRAILAAIAAEGVPLPSIGRLAETPEELAERCEVSARPAPRP